MLGGDLWVRRPAAVAAARRLEGGGRAGRHLDRRQRQPGGGGQRPRPLARSCRASSSSWTPWSATPGWASSSRSRLARRAFDRWNDADRSVVDGVGRAAGRAARPARRGRSTVADVTLMVGLARRADRRLPEGGHAAAPGGPGAEPLLVGDHPAHHRRPALLAHAARAAGGGGRLDARLRRASTSCWPRWARKAICGRSSPIPQFVLLGVIVILVHGAPAASPPSACCAPPCSSSARPARPASAATRRRRWWRRSIIRPWPRSACCSPSSATCVGTYLGLAVAQLLSGFAHDARCAALPLRGRGHRHARGGHAGRSGLASTRISATDLVSAAIVSNVCETAGALSAGRLAPGAGARHHLGDPRTRAAGPSPCARACASTTAPSLDADAVVANLGHRARARACPRRAERVGTDVVAHHPRRPERRAAGHALPAVLLAGQPARAGAPGRRTARWAPGPSCLAAARPGLVQLAGQSRRTGAARPACARVVFRALPDDRHPGRSPRSPERSTSSPAPAASPRRAACADAEDIVLEARTGLNIAFLSLNNERPALADRARPPALAHAIDRRALVAEALGGQGEPARNPLPPSLWGYATRTRGADARPALARRLLARGGMRRAASRRRCSWWTRRVPTTPRRRGSRGAVAADLAEIGHPRAAARGADAGPSSSTARRAATTISRSWAGRPTPPIPTISSPPCSLRDDRDDQPQPLPQPGDGRAAASRAAAPPTCASARRSTGRPRRCSRRDMPWVPLYHVSVFTAYRRARAGTRRRPHRQREVSSKVWKTAMKRAAVARPRSSPLAVAAASARPRRRTRSWSHLRARVEDVETARLDGVLGLSAQGPQDGHDLSRSAPTSRSPGVVDQAGRALRALSPGRARASRPVRSSRTPPRPRVEGRRRPAGAGRSRVASPGATWPS